VEKVHAVVARSTFGGENAKNTTCSDHFWTLKRRFMWQVQWILHLAKGHQKERMVVDQNSFIRKPPFFANKNVTFAKLSRTPRLSFAGPMLGNSASYEDSFTTCQITPENHGSLLNFDSLLIKRAARITESLLKTDCC